MTANWNDATIAETDDIVTVEGNAYFSPESIVEGRLAPSDTRTTCPWKGEAHYYDVVVGGDVNRDAAWTYPEPKAAAAEIKNRVAFWKGVTVG